jgi:hypothetical protein
LAAGADEEGPEVSAHKFSSPASGLFLGVADVADLERSDFSQSILCGIFWGEERSALPPARRFAILTCMDARLDPAKYAGLVEGDAHVIRNAGGRATDDAIRSLVISHKLLGMAEWFVIHHTICGTEGGFTRSSQQDVCRLIGETGQAPLRVSSNQASFGAAS